MKNERVLRCYDYVNHPYAQVQGALRRDAMGIFKRATTSAAEREHAIGVQLRVRVGILEVATDVRVEIGSIQDTLSSPNGYPITIVPLKWSSVASPSLFPRMNATLSVYPLSNEITQLELEGAYDPPLGFVGDAIDAVVGHRVAEAAVLQFLHDVAALLRTEPETSTAKPALVAS
jgi:hypothetical protein